MDAGIEFDDRRAPARQAVVVGAGAGGLAAAITLARQQIAVQLIDLAPSPGGTVADALIHTLGGIYDERQQFLNGGIVLELVERLSQASPHTRPRRIGKTWCLHVCPDVYRRVVTAWLAEEPLIQLACQTRVVEVQVCQGRATSIRIAGSSRMQCLGLSALVDATGSADVVRLCASSLVHDDEERAAGGLVFRLRNVRPGAAMFPKGVAVVQGLRAAAQSGRLPRWCAHAWVDQGVEEDEVFVKLFLPITGDWRQAEQRAGLLKDAYAMRDAVVDFLRQQTDFSRAVVSQTGTLGIRDGGRVVGEYCLTEQDVRTGRRFPDPACRCSWPIEYWNPKSGLELEYLPPGAWYEIPLRVLRVKGLPNVWVAGKCLSADHRAQASARVVGQCWAMGQAVGLAIAAELAEPQPPANPRIAALATP